MVAAAGDNHGEERAAGKGHTVGFLDNSREAKHFWVHLEWGYCSRCNDDRAEAIEDGFDGNSSIETSEMEDWVGDCGGIGFEGF